MQSIDSVEIYTYRRGKDLECKKEETKCKSINEYNSNLPQILDHPYKILIIEVSESGKNKCIT